MNSFPFFSLILRIRFPVFGVFLKSSNVFLVNSIKSYINPAYFTAVGYSSPDDVLNLKGTPKYSYKQVSYRHLSLKSTIPHFGSELRIGRTLCLSQST